MLVKKLYKGKKYKLIKDKLFSTNSNHRIYIYIYRIVALKRIIIDHDTVILPGEIGGVVSGYHNLSQEGDCWIHRFASVKGNARVEDNAQIAGTAKVFGFAKVYGNATVEGNAEVYGSAQVYDSAYIHDRSEVYGNTKVHGYTDVFGDVRIFGDVDVYDSAKVYGKGEVKGDRIIKDSTHYYVDISYSSDDSFPF